MWSESVDASAMIVAPGAWALPDIFKHCDIPSLWSMGRLVVGCIA